MLRLVCINGMKTNAAVAAPVEETTRIRIAPSVKPRVKRLPPVAKDLGVVGQIKLALLPKARLATSMGFLLGGFVPLATFWLSHHELDATPIYAQLVSYIVLGGLVYSAKTVYAWGKLAFQAPVKALGFVVLLEGVMVLSHTGWLSLMALVYLVCINGIATGCNLALPKPKEEEL